MQTDQTKLLALALLEIRGGLADYLGSDVDAPISVRVAAHIAYALHNEAEAAYNNADFQIEHASLKITAIDQILGVTNGTALLSRLDVQANVMPDSDKPV
ncbi:hypothetical protein PSCICN_32890 [Pseudomonas cichorii]|uniref:hypothetical protein n=1 Tax=Pseudomonas cichorii TaxID=36746 RepID=UPI001910EF1F|nr:hypothetical protein [Pseudomonas cichorii]GFM82597.1 hypothetical protein PSCICN_32890 [Pseudomonas cichorii]